MDNLLLKNSIRLLIGGYILDGGDVKDIPEILSEVAFDYKAEIEKIK